MPSIKVRSGEPFDLILRKFRRVCERAGIFSESRRRQCYEKPTAARKRETENARRRERQRVAMQRVRRRRYF